MSDFPTAKTNANSATEIASKHINNLENKVGIDNSADPNSLDYHVETHLVATASHPGATSIGGKTLPSGTIVGTTDSQVVTNKEATSPKLTAQPMISEVSGNEGKINYANDADRKAVGGRALEIIVKSPDDANYYREIISNRQGNLKMVENIPDWRELSIFLPSHEIIVYP